MRYNKGKIISLVLLFSCLAWKQLGFPQSSRYPFGKNDRDPFSPLVSPNGQVLIREEIDTKGLRLKGIIYSGTGSLAIINDETYKENDRVGDYTLVKIGKTLIILKRDKEKIILKMEEE